MLSRSGEPSSRQEASPVTIPDVLQLGHAISMSGSDRLVHEPMAAQRTPAGQQRRIKALAARHWASGRPIFKAAQCRACSILAALTWHVLLTNR